MLRRLGYVAIALSIDASTNRTCRLRNATPERLRELIHVNLGGLRAILEFNVANDVCLYRISSQLIPFASHPVNTLQWRDEFAIELREIGEIIREHDIRVSMHPGQFTVLNSANQDVVAASIRELEWHATFLDALGLDATHKLVIHGGGATNGKTSAMNRFADVADELPGSIRKRLVLENDETTYTALEMLELSGRKGFPVVFDWLHHKANHEPWVDTSEVLADCFRTWNDEDGPPKVHLSSQDSSGTPGKHAEWVDPRDAEALLRLAPDVPFDCMLEAKQKDKALFRLRDALRGRGITEGSP